MNAIFQQDLHRIDHLLQQTAHYAAGYLGQLEALPVSIEQPAMAPRELPGSGIGAEQALLLFQQQFGPYLTANAGPRYLGFVTGGVTPAALLGDWLTSTMDMNPADRSHISFHIEQETIGLLRQLFRLPASFSGCFVSGATMSNFTGLAAARQWLGEQQGIDIGTEGVYGLKDVKVLSATPHSSILKSLSMLGLGREAHVKLPVLPGREAVDIDALKAWIAERPGQPFIFVANAGTVNTVDFDDLAALARLKKEHNFWLHVDAAFGGFAACTPLYNHLLKGWEAADSITIDAHKWLNVPYDSAMVFSKHPLLQLATFQNAGAAYLGDPALNFNYINYAPENSRRLRSLPAWFSLQAYGAEGYRDIVENNVRLAQQIGEGIQQSSRLRLLAPVRMCVVCFSLQATGKDLESKRNRMMELLVKRGVVYVTPTNYQGTPGIRAALVNWRITDHDAAIVMQELESVAAEVLDLSPIIDHN